jgi:hypothetical protein
LLPEAVAKASPRSKLRHEVHVVPPHRIHRTSRGFPGEAPSVWVDIHSPLFDPAAPTTYNDFMDELEYAATCFDAICVNEHHSNGYGLMPSPA